MIDTEDSDECEFPLTMMRPLLGRTVTSIKKCPNADEGFRIEFTDGVALVFGFSGSEGTISIEER
jgi:hypothetical protein